MPGAGTEGRISRCCSSPRGGGGTALRELYCGETECVIRWRWYTGLYECDYTCSCVSVSVSGQCTVCIPPKCTWESAGRGWGVGGTDKRHLARRAKNNKGNLASSDVLYIQPLLAGSVLWGLGGYTVHCTWNWRNSSLLRQFCSWPLTLVTVHINWIHASSNLTPKHWFFSHCYRNLYFWM